MRHLIENLLWKKRIISVDTSPDAENGKRLVFYDGKLNSITKNPIVQRYFKIETSTWNRSALDDLLVKFGLQRFEKYAVALADRWFDLSGVVAVDERHDEKTLDGLERYILGSGTYGTSENGIAREMDYNVSVGKRVKYLMRVVFRPYGTMKTLYPVLTKVPILLPVMWVYRPIDIFRNRRAGAVRKLNAVMKPDVERVE